MASKEEILDAECEKIKDYLPIFELTEQEDAVYKAMDEYAKQESMAFYKWVTREFYNSNLVIRNVSGEMQYSFEPENGGVVSLEEVYSDFIKNKPYITPK